MRDEPTLETIEAAAARLAGRIHRTPVLRSAGLDALTGATLAFKCENFQRTGSFKLRGALNAVLSLSDAEAAPGALTHSSGNFAAALAAVAAVRGIRARVVMPENAPAVKRAAVRGYGGEISFCAPTLAAREETAARVQAETGARFIHPYDDYTIIAGQGTAALELWQDTPDLQAIVIPVGGGGLASGCALTTAALAPRAEILGAEPAGADDAYLSLLAGEPSGAVPLAAVLAAPARFRGRRVGLMISGGNVDLDALPWARPATAS